MRALIAATLLLLPSAALAQDLYDKGGVYEGVFANHESTGNNGSVRVGNRIGGPVTAPVASAAAPTQAAAGSGIDAELKAIDNPPLSGNTDANGQPQR